MASIRKRDGKLFFDFRYLNVRCREQTTLPDTPTNRKRLRAVLKKIESEINLGLFVYEKYFPNSKMLPKIKALEEKQKRGYHETPLFKEFAKEWFEELRPTWRSATAKTYQGYLDKRLIPQFGEKEVGNITKSDILKYRSSLAKESNGKLKPKTINKFIKCLNMIMSEAADRFNFNPPHLNIKPLKEEKVHIQPFSIEEVNLILANVRPDWRDYLLVRFFTGMRTGEIDGLTWEHIDFNRRQILVRQTFSNGRWEYTKNDGSQREIEMSTLVYNTLKQRYQQRDPELELVFHANNGSPIHAPNFLRRVWKPLLNYLKLPYRKPYQTRHTAATLWLAAGENPNWIAQQLGHSTTTMLFNVYSRYVPNLTRQDGSAIDRLLSSRIDAYTDHASNIKVSLEGDKERQQDASSLELVEGSVSTSTPHEEAQFWDQLLQDTADHASYLNK